MIPGETWQVSPVHLSFVWRAVHRGSSERPVNCSRLTNDPSLRHCALSAGLELEYELGGYLHQPRVFRSDDRPEGPRRQIRAYAVRIKLRVIEQIVGLESELHSRPLRNCGVLIQHEVPVVSSK